MKNQGLSTVIMTVIIILIVVLAAGAAYYFIFQINKNENVNQNQNLVSNKNTNLKQNLNVNINQKQSVNQNINTVKNLNVNLNISTDKTVYHSQENIILTVKLKSNQDVNNILVKAEGIKGRSANYFSKNQIVNLAADQEETVNLTSTLPSCSSCSGILPGDYSITTQVLYNNEVINQKTITINLQQ